MFKITCVLVIITISACIYPLIADEVQPVAIDATVTSFDSIPSTHAKDLYLIDTVEDTVLQRRTEGIVGATRVRRKKIAQIISAPLPALVVKNSLEGLLKDKELFAASVEEANYSLKINLYDFSLKETSDKVPQTMEANIALQLIIIDLKDNTPSGKFTIRSQNSKSALDTSKYAADILRGALESALKEIYQIISR